MGRWAAFFAGVPVIIHTIHGWGVHQYKNKIIKSFFIFLESLTAKITSRLVAVSNSDIEFGLRHGIGERQKYSLIRYGIDKHRFQQAVFNPDLRGELGFEHDAVLIGMIACFKPQKDHSTFISACAKVRSRFPRTGFILIGDGETRRWIESLISSSRMDEAIKVLGWRRDIPELIRAMDMVVLSSNWEGLPVVLIEAMASGRPILASDVCGMNEIVSDGVNGYLFPRGDAESLAGKMTLLLKDRDLGARISEHNRSSFPEFLEERFMMDKVCALYSELALNSGVKEVNNP